MVNSLEGSAVRINAAVSGLAVGRRRHLAAVDGQAELAVQALIVGNDVEGAPL